MRIDSEHHAENFVEALFGGTGPLAPPCNRAEWPVARCDVCSGIIEGAPVKLLSLDDEVYCSHECAEKAARDMADLTTDPVALERFRTLDFSRCK